MVFYHQANVHSAKKHTKKQISSQKNDMIQRVKLHTPITGQSMNFSEIYDNISSLQRNNPVPAMVVQSHATCGIGGHMILFAETEEDFDRNIKSGEYSYTKIDLSTNDTIPDTSSWSGTAKSSELTASNISSSYGSHSSGTGTGSSRNAGCIGFSINYKGSDRKELKYVTPSRILIQKLNLNSLIPKNNIIFNDRIGYCLTNH